MQLVKYYFKYRKLRNCQIYQIEESKEDSDDNFFMYLFDLGKEDDWMV